MKGPKDGAICASFSNVNILSNSNCCLGVSVGQMYHEGEKLEASLNLINANFAQCTIVVCDTLQRHTLLDDSLSAEEKYAVAKEKGGAWLERNYQRIAKLTIPYQIKRWDNWLQQPRYYIDLALVKAALQHEPKIKHGFAKTVDIFVNRLLKRDANIDVMQARENSMNYLLEEATIAMLMWQQEAFNYIAYPGEISSAFASIYDKYVNPEDQLVQWLNIKFKRYSRHYLQQHCNKQVCPSLLFDNHYYSNMAHS